MMPNVIFLVREVCQSLHTTMRWGEVFVGHNLLCYFGEQSVADGLSPNPILDDGKYKLSALIEDEIITFTLTNTFDSSEVLVDLERSGNGLWLSDRPKGIEPEDGAKLATKLATALQFSDGENEIDASVISWTLGAVVHLDAQSAAVPHSGRSDRISPDLTLSDQWDFDGLKFGDSGTLDFRVSQRLTDIHGRYDYVADDVTMLRIEYLFKSDLAGPVKINFKLNDLNTIEGVSTGSAVGEQQSICVLITHPPLNHSDEFMPERRKLKHTIAVNGATIAIERIRLSYYKPDPIFTWEIDGQLTRLRLRNTNFNQVLAGPVPIRWELLSGKPVDICVRLLRWGLGYPYRHYPDQQDVHTFFHSLEDFSTPIAFDHGTGTGRDGVLELSSTDLTPGFNAGNENLAGVYVEPVHNQSNRFWDRDDVKLNEVHMSMDELPAGSTRPVGISEADAIGFSKLPGIYYGTGEYLALRPIVFPSWPILPDAFYYSDTNPEDGWSSPAIIFEKKSCQIMLDDTMQRLKAMNFESRGYGIKVIKAWVSPDEIKENEWAHAQGRALDLFAIDIHSREAKPEFLPRLGEMASYFFGWVEHVPANPVMNEQAYIHVSRRFEVPTLAHPIIINDDLSRMAESHWEQVADFDDTELLDQLINRFPATAVCEAAFSYRYNLLMKSIDRLMESEFAPESHIEWKSESDVVIRTCHRFLLNFPGRNASENVRTLLFTILRRLEDAYADLLEAAREKLNVLQTDPSATEKQLSALRAQVNLDRGSTPEYHEFAVRYPATTEGRLAFARLYALESERVKRADSTEEYLSFMRDYPDAPQWDEIAERARDRSVADEEEVLSQLKLQVVTEDDLEDAIASRAAIIFLNEAETIKDQLVELLPDGPFAGPGDRETTTAYSDPNLARFLIATLLRKKYVARKMEADYQDLYTKLGNQIDLYMIQLSLTAIQIQISDLSELVKKNHLEITELVIRDGNETREQISKSFRAIAEGQAELGQAIAAGHAELIQVIAAAQAELSQVIEDGFAHVQLRFDSVDHQLKKIYDNTEDMLIRADQILENQVAAKKQLAAMEEAIVDAIVDVNNAIFDVNDAIVDVNDALLDENELTRTMLKKMDEIQLRSSSGGPGSGDGWFVTAGRSISGFSKKLGKKVLAEVGNLTAENTTRWVKDPGETLRKRWVAGKNSLEPEINRGIKAAKSTWWYQKINDLGEHLLLEDPGTNMEDIYPDSGFNGNGLPFIRPDYDADRPVYFINGINNSRTEARQNAQYLADLQNVHVRLIYNYSQYHKPHTTTPPGVQTTYGNDDLLECIYDKFWPAAVLNASKTILGLLLSNGRVQENPSARHLAYQFIREIKAGKDVRVVAHSQGTLICRNALLACQILQGSTSKVSCVLAGPALTGVEMISSSGLANLTWIVNRRDPIAPLLGMKADIKGVTSTDGLSRNEHNFSNERGDNHGGITPSGKRTYVRMILPEHLNASGQRGNTVFSVDD